MKRLFTVVKETPVEYDFEVSNEKELIKEITDSRIDLEEGDMIYELVPFAQIQVTTKITLKKEKKK